MNLLKSINSLVGSNLVDNAGKMRKYEVNIGGANLKPEIPDENNVKDKIESILNDDNKTITEKSLVIMCYLMRTQFFSDGNKRTAMLFSNKILVENGKGIISVPIEKDAEFGELLIQFYETNNDEKLKKWLYENCLNGIKN